MAEETPEGREDYPDNPDSSAPPDTETEAQLDLEPEGAWDQEVESLPELLYRQEVKRNFLSNYKWGLDVGSHSIKVVGLEKTWGKIKLVFASILEISPQREIPKGEEEEVRLSAILKVLDGLDLARNAMVTSMDSASVVLRQVSYPNSARDKLLSALRWETRRYLPFRPEEVMIDAQILDEGNLDGKMEVLLTAVPKDLYNAHLRFLEKAGIKPVLVDIGSLATLNSYFADREPNPDETLIFLDLGASSSFVTIFRPAGSLFALSLTVGGYRITKEIRSRGELNYTRAECMKCKFERGQSVSHFNNETYYPLHEALQSSYELLADEIRQTLVYYNKQTGINKFDRIILSGGGAGLSDFTDFLNLKLGIEAEICNPLEGIEIDPRYFNKEQLYKVAPQLALAFGLAIRGIEK